MKRLLKYNKFKLLLEEVEVNYSKSIYEWISSEDDKVPYGNDNQFYKKLQNDNFVDYIQEVNISDIIYDSYPIKLGSMAFNLLQKNMTNKLGSDLLSVVNKTKDFGILKDTFGESFLSEIKISFFLGFYSEPKTDNGTTGGFFKPKFRSDNGKVEMIVPTININKSNDAKLVYNSKKTIRHELQHFTQYINSMFLSIGEYLIKDNFKTDIETVIIKVGTKVKYKTGLGKTFLNLNQNVGIDDKNLLDQFNKMSLSYPNLKSNDNDLIDTDQEKKVAKVLAYWLSDEEYKTYLSDVVEKYVESYFSITEDYKGISGVYRIYKKYSDIVDNISIKNKEKIDSGLEVGKEYIYTNKKGQQKTVKLISTTHDTSVGDDKQWFTSDDEEGDTLEKGYASVIYKDISGEYSSSSPEMAVSISQLTPIKESLSEEEKRKMEFRKEIKGCIGERFNTYIDVIKYLKESKNFFNKASKNIFNNILTEDRVSIVITAKKETSANLVKLINKKLDEKLLSYSE